ncbi:MAG: DUF3048 domain-containing protein [bacterium]|nr:DUF3048 domain-containing protein [bacterium]
MSSTSFFEAILGKYNKSRSAFAIGIFVLLLLAIALLYFVFTGRLRGNPNPIPTPDLTPTSTVALFPRRLDGVLVPQGETDWAPRAVVVENHSTARPLSGVSKASVAIEAPVEGGITRFILLFDATTTVPEIGPVRSARPYYVDWARSWFASFFHVGGSPDALTKIRSLGANFNNIDEMTNGRFFWRSSGRFAPHNTYTSQELMNQAVHDKNFSQATMPILWHFKDAATTTERGDVLTIKIPYGNVYNVTWKFNKERGVYVRYQAGLAQKDKDGSPVESDNVVLIKTDSQVLDKEGRLQLRTTGSGDAMAYRDGNKYPLRWTRATGQTLKFESTDGTEFILNRGKTWIEVTTDDRIFAGLEVK